jgi:hypothetical protein
MNYSPCDSVTSQKTVIQVFSSIAVRTQILHHLNTHAGPNVHQVSLELIVVHCECWVAQLTLSDQCCCIHSEEVKDLLYIYSAMAKCRLVVQQQYWWTNWGVAVVPLPFLGVFAKLRKAAIILMSICPQGTTRLPLDGFWWNLIFETSSKICQENSNFIKILQK